MNPAPTGLCCDRCNPPALAPASIDEVSVDEDDVPALTENPNVFGILGASRLDFDELVDSDEEDRLLELGVIFERRRDARPVTPEPRSPVSIPSTHSTPSKSLNPNGKRVMESTA